MGQLEMPFVFGGARRVLKEIFLYKTYFCQFLLKVWRSLFLYFVRIVSKDCSPLIDVSASSNCHLMNGRLGCIWCVWIVCSAFSTSRIWNMLPADGLGTKPVLNRVKPSFIACAGVVCTILSYMTLITLFQVILSTYPIFPLALVYLILRFHMW